MLRLERHQIRLDEPVMRYLPEFGVRGKERITVRHLLTHTSGLNPGLSRSTDWSGYDKGIAQACVHVENHRGHGRAASTKRRRHGLGSRPLAPRGHQRGHHLALGRRAQHPVAEHTGAQNLVERLHGVLEQDR